MRTKREMILEKLQEELKTKVKTKFFEKKLILNFRFFCFKEDELNRIRFALDESNYYRKQQEDIVSKLQTEQQIYSTDNHRIKSAPHFGGIHRKVEILFC
jgi:hypothetical protein